MFARLFPLLGVIGFLVIGVLWRGWLQYRRYGTTGIALFQSGTMRQTRDILFCLLFAVEMGQAAIFAFSPQSLSGAFILTVPEWALSLGGFLTVVGLALTVAAQLGMGASWRIGIDTSASPGLVTSGLYQFCRNPIYLGMIASLVGIALMLPTWLSVALLGGVLICIRTQVAEEELYLERMYGSVFRCYAAQVGRFWPSFGRLKYTLLP